MKHKVNVEIKVTSAEIDDIMCTAIEGGIDYWCESYCGSGGDFSLLPENQVEMKYEWEHLVYGGYLTMDEDTSDLGSENFDADGNYLYTGMTHKLDQESFMKGLQMWIDEHHKVQLVRINNSSIYPYGYTTIDTGDIDAHDADCIVQYALFGELKYC
tara:strand:- start:865 stop:1335 length:471 start_codon:yes stop_codon:yes gene_type:complete